MGTAFSSSLFGLAGSLVLGFLDLQAGQAQSMFYNDLEDWLSTVTDLDPDTLDRGGATTAEDLRVAIERLSRTIHEDTAATIGDGRAGTTRATTAMANLAEGIQGLVQHMRSEQQVVRSWVETQSEQQQRGSVPARDHRPRAADAGPGSNSRHGPRPPHGRSRRILAELRRRSDQPAAGLHLPAVDLRARPVPAVSREITGKDTVLQRLNAQIAQLTEMLALEKAKSSDASDTLAALQASLSAAESERDRLRGLLDNQAGASSAAGDRDRRR